MPRAKHPKGASVAIAFDLIYPHSKGGGERQYRAFAEELARLGFDVDYLTSLQTSEDGDPQTFRLVPVCGPLRLYDETGVRRGAAALQYAWGLFRALVRNRGRYKAIIVSSTPVLNVFAARAALAGSGTRVIVDYLEVWDRPKWVDYAGRLTGIVAWLLQRIAIAITPYATCHSQLTARRLAGEGYKRTLAVSPGLIDGTSNPGQYSHAAHPPYVLYAGRHIADKRVESLPAAVERVRRQIPELELVILGRGTSTPAVVQAAAGKEWIRMPGFVDEDELRELMAHAACLANPSRREGYGLVVVEAAAFGTPVVLVADENNASTELISTDVNGFVARSASPADLGEALTAVLAGGEALRMRTRDWYETAVRTRTIEQTVKGILPLLNGAPGNAPGNPGSSADQAKMLR